MSESKNGASPLTKESRNYKIPLILGVIGLLLVINPFFYSAYVDVIIGRGGPDDVSASWAFVQAFYHFTPTNIIILIIALFMAFAKKISNIPSSDN